MLICIMPTISFAQQPEQKEMTILIEGMPETVLMTLHTVEALFALWYDSSISLLKQRNMEYALN